MHHLQFLSHVVLSWDRILLGEVGLSLGRARAEEGAEAPGLSPESRRGRRGDTKKKYQTVNRANSPTARGIATIEW